MAKVLVGDVSGVIGNHLLLQIDFSHVIDIHTLQDVLPEEIDLLLCFCVLDPELLLAAPRLERFAAPGPITS